MAQYLCISATLLSARYHAEEWPPSPARLFQALLAGAKTGINQNRWADLRPVLEKLERLPAPEILACSARPLRSYRISVPNNDSDEVARAWKAGREFDAGAIRTMKQISPRAMATDDFDKPHLHYLWRTEDEVNEGPVRQLTWLLHTLGWGIDMAFADCAMLDDEEKHKLVSGAGYLHYAPAERGKRVAVPISGYLNDLIGAYKNFCERRSPAGVDPSTRAYGYGQQKYLQSGSRGGLNARFLLRQLADESVYYSVPWTLGMKVAAWTRHVAAEALREEQFDQETIDSYLLGHGDGHARHVSFVPVPSIRSLHGDGAIRRVMIVEPPDGDGEITGLLQVKLAAAELMELSNSGPARPACVLEEAPESDGVFRAYLTRSRIWQTVTPVVLHGHNSEHGGKFSLRKTEQLLYQALEKSGYNRHAVGDIHFQAAPYWPGTGGALGIRVPEHLNKWPRYHVSIRFYEPVAGPVLVGIGRHYGIGLFASQSG